MRAYAFQNTAAFGWLQDGKVEIRIGCQKHMKPVSKATSGGGTGPGVMLLCPDGCVIWEWENDEKLAADVKELRSRIVWK